MEKESAYPIFLNYRWTDTAIHALWLSTAIESAVGLECAVFRDKRMQEGTEWAKEIEERLAMAQVVLVLIGEKWFDCRKKLDDYNDERWIKHPDCWVRREIENALASGKYILPVVLKGARWPESEEKADQAFPKSIRAIHRLKPFRIDPDQPDTDLERLIRLLRERLNLSAKKESPALPKTDPLADFPLPTNLQERLPKARAPYPGLHYFTESNARLFFGRSGDIRELWRTLNYPGCRVVLLFGYSGVGKSSLLHAGLLPRVKRQGWEARIERRDKERGLQAQLETLLAQIPVEQPSLLVLDQVEESFTDPHPERPEELAGLIDTLPAKLAAYPQLRLILGFRKEFLPEFRDALDRADIRPYDHFLKPLGREGIREAIAGVADQPALADYYRFRLSPGLVEAMTQDIAREEDGGMPEGATGKAPLLQIQLRNLWDATKKLQPEGEIELSEQLYREKIRREDMGKQLEEQLAQLPARLGDLGRAVQQNGLALDLLHFFTTSRSTAATHRPKELRNRYPTEHQTEVERLIRALEDLHLLIRLEQGAVRLAHDAWAPFVRERFNNSDAPGQRAWRIVESKRRDIEQGRNVQFSETDLEVIEEGREGMPVVPERVEEVIRTSAEALAASRRQFARVQNDNVDFLLERVDNHILQLQYTQALDALRGAGELGARQREIARRWQELAFYHRETGNDGVGPLVKEQLQKLGLELPDYPQKPEAIRNWLRTIDSNHFVELTHRYFPVMLKVEGGRFIMGDEEWDNARPHQVELKDFALAQTPCTFWQFGLYCTAVGKDVRDYSPSWGVFGDNPAVNVRWYEVVAYANWLSEELGLLPVYEIDRENKDSRNENKYDDWKWTVRPNWNANGFRLPTEAEWEYAARGGQIERDRNFRYAGSDKPEEVGWFSGNARRDGVLRTHPVMELKMNGLGLYDMSGNVFEWCWDWFGENYYEHSPKENPAGPEKGDRRVVRGGSWDSKDNNCRVSYRNFNFPNYWFNSFGCRLLQGFTL